ncbi:hypothetical protein N7363_22295 [Stutzerimonas stutzeri]|nr:hypothetical protein [Stutzerimonas stutzeri]MDH0428069.1 hypothetical protein [Stutzerimonas stutzeri]
MIDNLPNVAEELFARSIPTNLGLAEGEHKPRILLLYGSNRERSYSRLSGPPRWRPSTNC